MSIKPRPQGLVAYYGYGDVDGDWYTKPSEFYRKQKLVDKEQAYKAIGGTVLTETESVVGKDRGRFYLYLRQNGLWTKEVTGLDPNGPAEPSFEPRLFIGGVSPVPVWMIQSTTDEYVTEADFRTLERAARPPKRLVLVDAGNHRFTDRLPVLRQGVLEGLVWMQNPR
jgi:fermentation-respiration switch protein FrsA (DUF1100 family)